MNTAILFDTMSIQDYVFSSNKLKDNLGASYIVEHVYDYLKVLSESSPKLLQIGFIGGGNALLFTTSHENALQIVRLFTTRLLHTYPGLSVAVAIAENFNHEKEHYSNNIKNLFKSLSENKSKFLPVTTIPSHGITDLCRFSPLSVEKINIIDDQVDLMSSVIATKRIIEKEARDNENKLLSELIETGYAFPTEFNNLGQQKNTDSHIAVVHIDGNGFGEVFRNIDSKEATSILSEKVHDAVRNSFKGILDDFISFKKFIIPDLQLSVDKITNLEELPIRPIIIGGDDVTFVCHSRLGIWFAEKFTEHFTSNYFDSEKTQQFGCCAGIAIVKTKFPFYRAYQMAEELCVNAKKKNRESGGNWIDFQLAYGGLGNELDEVRTFQYKDVKGFQRPYCLSEINGSTSFAQLKTMAAKLKMTLPNSKIKDLREMLTRDEAYLLTFLEHLKHQHSEKDGFAGTFFNSTIKENTLKTIPFFDMIELIELYPSNLLK